MKELHNYQWPQCFIKKIKLSYKNSTKINLKLIHKIENFFYQKFKRKAVLFPSGRSCLGAILEFNKLNRSNEIYLSKWVSNCLFNAVGYFSNPTINLVKPDMIIYNNIWGSKQKILLKKIINKKIHLVDDSCDSIILNSNTLFPNKSEYEFFSLPKIIGSISGGIIISKNLKFLKFCKKRQEKNVRLGKIQSILKFNEINNKSKYDYRYNEVINSYLDTNALKDIDNNLDNYELNKKIILKRMNELKSIISIEKKSKRVGPLIPIDINKLKNHNQLKKIFLFRHKLVNTKKNTSKVYLLFPVHYKITSLVFKKYLNALKKNIK